MTDAEIITPGRELVFPGKGKVFIDSLSTDPDGMPWVCFRRLRQGEGVGDMEWFRSRTPDFIGSVRLAGLAE